MTLPPIKRFWSLLRQYKIELRQIYAYAIFNGMVNLTLPLGIQAIVNYIQTGELTSSWVVLVFFVLIGIAITGTLQVWQLKIVENIQQDLFTRSAFEFAYRLPRISFLQLDRIHAPELVNRFFDTLTIQKGLPKILIDFSLAAFQIIFGLILLTIYSPYFVILALGLVVMLWFIFRVTGQKGLNTSLTESKYKYKLAHWLEEVARVNRSFKLNSTKDFHLHKTDVIVGNYLSSRQSHFGVLINQFRFFIAFKVFLAAGLLLLGGYLVFQEQMNIGQFVAAEIIIILIINSVEKIIRIIDTIYDVLTGLEKIGYVTDLNLDKDTGTVPMISEGGLTVKAVDVQFSFPNEKTNIIDELSFEIAANARVLLTGRSGSGKTLLLQILAGIIKPDEGEIYFNDVPALNYQSRDLHQALALSFPTNQLFEGSFRENITMGRPVSDTDLTATIRALQLENYLMHQPRGLDHEIDSGGRRLPRSIIQKLLIARLIVNRPKLLLLEDPLQFIEEKEKIRIIDFLMDPKRSWTVMVISDFAYWKKKCDQIINLNEIN